jgi:sporulation protein YlmC with PRC-barrel domain
MGYGALLAGFACAIAWPALAQDAIRQNQAAEELRADWIVGTTVTTPAGETIGTIDDVLLDQEDGVVTAAIVSVGGFLGFGAKQIAVKWDDLQQEYDASEIVLDISREEAEAAPEFNFRDQQLPPPPPPPATEGTGGLGGGGVPPPPPQ